MASLELSSIRKTFGQTTVLDGVDLAVPDGEFCVFVGPSGCGKSTLLRIVAGLEGGHGGDVRIGGRDVTKAAPADRGVAMVFQSYALYPHMNVSRNISFGLTMQGMPKAEIARKVAAAADMLQLKELLHRRPSELSGGQRQRVAIGRALVRQPDIFLFDEPLSNLDAALRVQMRIEITRLHDDLRATMIYVTHDQVEAMTMADRIVVMNGGRIEQVGDPLTLYDKPANLFVAGFIGSPKMNLVPVTVVETTGDAMDLEWPGGARLRLPDGASGARPGPAILGIRPEHVSLVPGDAGDCRGVVRLAEHLGGETLLHVDIRARDLLIVKDVGRSRWRAGDAAALKIDPEACHLFETTGKALQRSRRTFAE